MDAALAQVCAARFDERYPPARAGGGRDGRAHPLRAEAIARLEQELRLIAELGLSGFFLLHRDLLELAREVAGEVRGPDTVRALLPPGRGRGSSVSSIVCYLTGLSHVDPIANDLFLGRFLNEEITALPDIDLDFPRDIREVLIPRVHERYGRERSALVAAFPTYRARGAIRELGKALGLPPGEIERVARGSEGCSSRVGRPRHRRGAGGGDGETPTGRWGVLAELADEAYGLPRHLSQHSGGMIVATRPLVDCCPVVPAAMEGRQMVMWDKDSCADAGFLKIDLLGLGMLSAVERCVEPIARRRGERIDLSRIPYDDPETYERDPARRDDRRLPDREPRADGLAAAHAARDARRPHDPGGDRPPRADPGRRGQPLHRAPPAPARGPRRTRSPTTTRRSSPCCATRSGRSSSRTRSSRSRWPSPGSRRARRRGCAAR